MDKGLTWKDVGATLETMPRGSKRQLAISLEIDPSDLSRRLLRDTELSARQVALWREFLAKPGARGEEASFLPPPTSDRQRLPVYGYAAGSDGDRIAFNEGQVVDWIDLPMGLLLGPGDYFSIRPIGSSMEPRIFAGEPLVARYNFPPSRGKDVVLEFEDGTALIKTYQGQRDGHIHVEQWNEHKTLTFPATGVKLHAVAFKL